MMLTYNFALTFFLPPPQLVSLEPSERLVFVGVLVSLFSVHAQHTSPSPQSQPGKEIIHANSANLIQSPDGVAVTTEAQREKVRLASPYPLVCLSSYIISLCNLN